MRFKKEYRYVVYFQFNKLDIQSLGAGMSYHITKLPLSYRDLDSIADDIRERNQYLGVVITGFQEVRREPPKREGVSQWTKI